MNNSASAFAQRQARVRLRLVERDLQVLLISHLPNIRYLTGFTGSNGWLFLGLDGGLFVTDGRYETQAREEIAKDSGLEILTFREGLLDGLADRAANLFENCSVGFEAKHLRYSDWERLTEQADQVAWTACDGVVESVRAIKDPDEIAAIRKAVEIASAALRETIKMVRPGIREVDVAVELDYRMNRFGAERPSFETIVASGPRTALPHAATSVRVLEGGDLLLIDFGARWNGYCCDLTRTFVVGEPRRRQAEVYDLVLEAQRCAVSALRAGRTGAEVDAAARGLFAEHDLEDRFPHSTGHGLGLEVHEGPRLGRRSEESLESGMVVTIEPGLYFPDWGGIRIEDDLVVTRGEAGSLVDLEKGELQGLRG